MDDRNFDTLTGRARELRKNMTPEERHLWYDYLSHHPARFTKQRVVGKYIADFYCASAKLIIEVDGSQHYEDEGLKRDAVRTAHLNDMGIDVIRVPNNAVHENFEGVCDYIEREIRKRMDTGDLKRRNEKKNPKEKEKYESIYRLNEELIPPIEE